MASTDSQRVFFKKGEHVEISLPGSIPQSVDTTDTFLDTSDEIISLEKLQPDSISVTEEVTVIEPFEHDSISTSDEETVVEPFEHDSISVSREETTVEPFDHESVQTTTIPPEPPTSVEDSPNPQDLGSKKGEVDLVNPMYTTLYKIGFSPIKYNSTASFISRQFVVFMFIQLCGFLWTAEIVKYFLLFKRETYKEKVFIIDLMYFGNIFFLLIAYICTLTLKRKSALEMLEALQTWKAVLTDICSKSLPKAIVYISVGVSILTAVLQTFIDGGQSWGWNMKQILLFHSNSLAVSCLDWEISDTNRIDLIEKYGTHLNPKTFFMGVTQMIININGLLMSNFILDVLLMSSITMQRYKSWFCDSMKGASELHSGLWRKYKILRELHDKLNATFWLVLQLEECKHLLLTAYLVSMYVNETKLNMEIFIHILPICKFFLLLGFSENISRVNDRFKQWIKRNYMGEIFARVGENERINIMLLLDDLSSEPIGVGSSMFFINRRFLVKFSGLVSTISAYYIKHLDDLDNVGREILHEKQHVAT